MSIAPSDKSTRMGSPVKPAFPQSYNEFADQQTKTAGIVGKADIKVHPEDDRGNIVTLLKGIRGKWNGLNYRVPKGFESDGVSTPSILWPIISPPVHPHTIRGGIIHDWLYRHQPRGWTREQADKVFRDVIEEDGLSPLQADLAYIGLRMFGDKAWDANAKRKLIERAAQRAKNKRTNNTEAEAGQAKAASEEHTMITYTQAYQTKQASLQKKATLIGRGINSLFGADTWMGRTFGESPETAAENFFRDDEAVAKRKELADQYDAQQAAMQARIDAGLAAAQKRLAEGKGVTQQPGYKAPTAVAKTQAKPKAQAVPPPPKKQMSGQEAFQQRSRGIRTKENDRAMRTADAAVRRKDSAGGKR